MSVVGKCAVDKYICSKTGNLANARMRNEISVHGASELGAELSNLGRNMVSK